MADISQRVKDLENQAELLWQEVKALRQRIGRTWEMSDRLVIIDRDYLANSAFDGDSFSDVGSNTKIENTSWKLGSDSSAYTIPTDAKALFVRLYARDSGSAGTAGLYFALYCSATASVADLVVAPSGKANDDLAYAAGLVRTTDGDIWYQCNASGSNTLDVTIRVIAYII